jgi:hypothetical protein
MDPLGLFLPESCAELPEKFKTSSVEALEIQPREENNGYILADTMKRSLKMSKP